MAAKQSRDGSGNSFSHESSFSQRYGRIPDSSQTTQQDRGLIAQALVDAGLESSNLIVGIDFTKSNEWTGTKSFNGRCLHSLIEGQNPYVQAISIIGSTLSIFDEDNRIPCFGFGDVSTHDRHVFSFYPSNRPCNGFEEVLSRYKEMVPHVKLAGPTSFAPIIETAIGIVDQSGGQYHILLIIADGQVTGAGLMSLQEQNTVNAIVKASEYPLSIIVVGVGDGPRDMMQDFDDNIPDRAFDNVQFVNFTKIMSRNIPLYQKETEFALAAFMKIPLQYTATLELQLLGNQRGHSIVEPLPPPKFVTVNTDPSQNFPTSPFSFPILLNSDPSPNYPTSTTTSPILLNFIPRNSPTSPTSSPILLNSDLSRNSSTSPTSSPVLLNSRRCSLCFNIKRYIALGCGHQMCHDCSQKHNRCPICYEDCN